LADALVERARPSLDHPQRLDVAVLVAAPSARLAADLGSLLCARLRSLGVRSALTSQAGGGFERILRLQVDSVSNRLRISGDVLGVPSSTWEPEPLLLSHLAVEVPLDAELRAYLPSAVRDTWQARGYPLGDLPLLALGVGDLD